MKRKWTAIFAALGMAALIFDSRTALLGAQTGMEVCIKTVIPSLFPFFVLSILLGGALREERMGFLAPIARLLRVPDGAMPLILVGLLGGYPVGAQGVALAHREGRLHQADAWRMLAFCSNAGPAFIFGMGARLFPQLWVCFLVWAVHIASSWCVALLTPCDHTHTAAIATGGGISLPQAMRQAIITLASVCGWVVLFRILIAFADRWALWAVSREIRAMLIGAAELANGCCTLPEIPGTGLRMTAFASLLSFGGLCVAMQTASVCQGTNLGLYLPGKVCQAAISCLLCIPAQLLLPMEQRWYCGAALTVVLCAICVAYRIYAVKTQKSSSILSAAVV